MHPDTSIFWENDKTRNNGYTQKQATNLGLDMCESLGLVKRIYAIERQKDNVREY